MRPKLLSLAAALFVASTASAEAARFRYAPADALGNLVQVAAGPNGALGERLTGFGLAPQAFPQTFRPNQMVTFVHPYTGRNVVVPLTLPRGNPRIEHRAASVLFNYGSYATDVRFLPDGAVDVIYNSGFLRPLVIE